MQGKKSAMIYPGFMFYITKLCTFRLFIFIVHVHPELQVSVCLHANFLSFTKNCGHSSALPKCQSPVLTLTINCKAACFSPCIVTYFAVCKKKLGFFLLFTGFSAKKEKKKHHNIL